MKRLLVVLGLLLLLAAFLIAQSPVTGTNVTGAHPTVNAADVVAKTSATAQSANVSATTVYTVPSSGAGMYRMNCYVVLTQAATTSSTLPSCMVSWTDADTSVVNTVRLTGEPTANLVGTTGNYVLITNNTGSYGTTTYSGVGTLIIRAKAGTNVQYSTIDYASSGATPMKYFVYVKLEYVGE